MGLPRTSEAMTEALNDPIFVETFSAFIDSVTPPVPYLADSGTHPNSCPMENCKGTLEPLPFPAEAFCRRRADQDPAKTSRCPDCDTSFAHKEVLLQKIHAFALEHKIDIDPLIVEQYRCCPPELPSETGELSNLELVYLALSILDFQVHHETHTKSCFKITSRTPQGFICRYFFPRLARLQATVIDIDSGKVISHRLIGCEYYNICSLLWIRLTKSNMDIQFLINGGSRRTTSYSTKYTFKVQKPASALTLKIGLLTEAFKRTFTSPDDSTLSPLDRGRRAINKALYQFTKPQELHLTMAAYILLNDGPFVRSHEPVYINLKQLCASISDRDDDHLDEESCSEADDGGDNYLDTDDDGDGDGGQEDENDSDGGHYLDPDDQQDSDGDQENEDDVERLEDEGLHDDEEEDNDEGGDKPEDDPTSGYVDVQVSAYALREPSNEAPDEDRSEEGEEENEADRYLSDICLLTDYWYRPPSMSNFHFAYVRENFHIVKSKPTAKSGLAMCLGHPNPDKRYWLRNEHHERRCLIFSGGKVRKIKIGIYNTDPFSYRCHFDELYVICKP